MTRRVIFLGNDPWSVPSLDALVSAPDIEVTRVITNPPRPAGRGSALRPTAVSEAATRLGVPLAETAGVRSGDGWRVLKESASDVDALVVVAYGELLSPESLALTPGGAVNLHFSSLPRWRGASPVQRALMAGDPETGVTAMLMDEGLDTGPLLAQRQIAIDDDEDAGRLGARLADIGAAVLVDAVIDYLDGRLTPTPQPQEGATYAPKIGPAERWLDWSESAVSIVGRIRGLAPEPTAVASFREVPLKVFAARGEASDTPSGPSMNAGTVVSVDRDGVVVLVGRGSSTEQVRLLEVAAAGRKRMSAADWARGARVRPGDAFDAQAGA